MEFDVKIPFNKPYLGGDERHEIDKVLRSNQLHGDGEYTKSCHQLLKQQVGATEVFLTGSCTLAMEMAALVLELGDKDEVLVPDFTFVSTAQSIAIRGAIPVLCDIRADTLNIDETRLEEAITKNTKAIMPVHYGGVSAEMNKICAIAKKHNLYVIEDAAQAIGCKYHGGSVGSLGDMSAFSFHSTKNIHCGEGGALVLNDSKFADLSAMAWEKGTNRRQFVEGNVQKYQWKTLGSSYLPSEITAAILHAQLMKVSEVNSKRLAIWNRYFDAFSSLAEKGCVQLPNIPTGIEHNGHLFFLILPEERLRKKFIRFMSERGIQVFFHYTPLHQSDGGRKYCREGMELQVAADLPQRLVRLPLYPDLKVEEQIIIIAATFDFFDVRYS